MTRIVLCFVLVAWIVGDLGGSDAEARVSRKNRVAARKLVRKGKRAFRKRNFKVAIKHFIGAYKIDRLPDRVYWIARCHRGLGNYKHAIGAFMHYLKAAGKKVRARRRRQVQRYIKSMELEQGRLQLEITPKGATVLIDGKTMGKAPLAGPITIDPGKRTVKVTKAGYKVYTKELNFHVGRRVTLMVTLDRIVRTGELVISSPVKGALVSIQGGKPVPLPHRTKLLEGSWQLKVTAPVHKPRTITVAVVGDKVTRQRVELSPLLEGPRGGPVARRVIPPRPQPRPEPRPAARTVPVYKRAWFWTIISVVVVGAGATAGYFIWSGSQPEDNYDLTHRFR